jgi:PPOX class probable F420-dependent enzyme
VSALTSFDLELLTDRSYAHLVTLRKDGSPHSTPVWVDATGDLVLVNTAVGRAKDRHIRRDPRVALSVLDRKNPYRWVSISGVVVDITSDGAEEHIDILSRRYDRQPYRYIPGQVREILKIRPDRIVRSG